MKIEETFHIDKYTQWGQLASIVLIIALLVCVCALLGRAFRKSKRVGAAGGDNSGKSHS